MATVQLLPLGNYANGQQDFGPIDVADDVTEILFGIQRCTTATPTVWPSSSTTVEIIPQVSTDGGATYVEAGRTMNAGGIQTFKGTELAFSQSGGSLPPPANGITRKYKVSTIVAGGPIRTSLKVDVN